MHRAFASVVFVLLLGTSASAICPNPRPRLLCAEYFQDDAVVIAKLLGTRHVTPPNPDDDDYYLYTMHTERILRGRIGAGFHVVEAIGSGRARFEWRKGQSYLLLLSYKKADKAWALDACGSSAPLEKSAETLKAIDQLQAGGDGGTIHGRVWLDPGATVLVRGTQGTFETMSDQQGRFEVHVPAGEYNVSVIHEGKRFEPDNFSYEDPRKLRVPNGGCAQVQFNLSEQK